MSKKIKSFKTLVEIDIGDISHSELLKQATETGDIAWTDWVDEIYAKTEHLHLPRRISVEIVPICIRIDLPVRSKEKTLRPLYEEAFENKLCLCPPSVALEILLQTRKEFVGEASLAMKPVLCTCTASKNMQENILSISDGKCAIPGNRWLNGTHGCLDDFADGGYTLLFCRRCPTLVRAGYASI